MVPHIKKIHSEPSAEIKIVSTKIATPRSKVSQDTMRGSFKHLQKKMTDQSDNPYRIDNIELTGSKP